MAKDLNISILMDFYGQLLSDRQLDMMDMYYNQDLSLAEIAEEAQISRQGVRDAIKRAEKQLAEYEEKLGLVKRFSGISAQISKMDAIISSLGNTEKIAELKSISQKLLDEI